MNRLSSATLSALPASLQRPTYDRSKVTPGIVHLGIGAFHRAHMAAMTDAVLHDDPSWGIIGASLRSGETRDALQPQGGLYTMAIKTSESETLQVVGAVLKVLVATDSPSALIDAMADPHIRIVSLTVTEKGYCHDPATGGLNAQHPDIIHDLANPETPRSAPGFLLAALAKRRAGGTPPFTVLCCDNLPANGKTMHRVLIQIAERTDPALAHYVAQNVRCPGTMVDRIVPATTDEDRDRIASAIGLHDAWPVVTEPFLQWVIEDDFPLGRPQWENTGAQFAGDIEAFEHMKLRCLNGAHSTLAYLGPMAGHVTVTEAAHDPAFITLLQGFWSEVRPSLRQPQGQDLQAYCDALLARFQNRAVRHRLLQIAMDGSQKLPQRLLGTIRDSLAAGRAITHLALGVAAWMAHVAQAAAPDAPHQLNDPMATTLLAAASSAGRDPGAVANALLGIDQIFGRDLPSNLMFRQAVIAHLRLLLEIGCTAAMATLPGARR